MTYYYIQLIINGIALGSVYSLIALGFTLIFSVLKFSNFSHGGVMVVSAYFAYIVCKSWNLGFVPMILITVLFGGCLSCLVQFIGFERLRRTKGSSMLFFVSSANLGTLLQNIIILMFASSYYSYPSFFSRSFFQINENLTIAVTDMIMLGLSAVGILVLMYILYKTRMGISIRALSMDSDTAKLMGINVSFVMALTFFISGMLAAIAGVLCGMKFLLYPQLKDLVMKGMTASILGGLGNISGALYGGLLLGLLEVFMTNFVGSSLQPACTFLFAIIFLIFRPQGISGKFVKEKV
ncbi:MAG: branched-chain amino acid ABC transporter permease [Clostridiales bacterium]|jgi:hypothetical protein|nr:branched-chain amino acid ABC transporter permease [Clostridiales bacterium]